MLYLWIKKSAVRSFLVVAILLQAAVVLIATATAIGSRHHDSHTVLLAWVIVCAIEMCFATAVALAASVVYHLD